MRPQIPIYVQCEDVLIINNEDINDIRNNNPRLYEKLLLSGELEYFYHGYVLEELIQIAKKEKIEIEANTKNDFNKNIFVGNELSYDMSRLMEQEYKENNIELLPKVYRMWNYQTNNKLLGYHAQKTIILLEKDLYITAGNVDFQNFTFMSADNSDKKIFLRKSTKAVFKNMIFGNVMVEIIDESEGSFENCDFDGTEIGIIQKDNAVIKKISDVSYNNTKHNLHIENFSKYTVREVDISNPYQMKEFLSYSIIDNLIIDEDIDYTSILELEIDNSINIITSNPEEKFAVVIPHLTIRNNFSVAPNIFLYSDINAVDSNNISISAGMLVGKMDLSGALDVIVSDTVFMLDTEEYIVKCKNTGVLFRDVVAAGNKKFIFSESSQLFFERFIAEDVDRLISFSKVSKAKGDNDEYFALKDYYEINDSKIFANKLLYPISNMIVPAGVINNSEVAGNNESSPVVVMNTSIEINNCSIVNRLGSAIVLISSYAKITKSKFMQSNIGVEAMKGSLVDSEGISIDYCDTGIRCSSSNFYGLNASVQNSREIGIKIELTAEYKESFFSGYRTEFTNNKKDVDKKNGSLFLQHDTIDEYFVSLKNEFNKKGSK